MFRRVIVPLDGTRFAEHAVPVALALAVADDCRLILAHVDVAPLPLDEPHVVNVDDVTNRDEYTAATLDYLTDVAGRISASKRVDVEWIILTGDVPRAIERLGGDRGADLIVMASHDRSALGRLVLRSKGERIVRNAGLPVLLVRKSESQLKLEREADPATVTDPITGQVARFQNVLAPLDGAPLSEVVLEPARQVAQATGARITVMTVCNTSYLAGGPPDFASRSYLEAVARGLRNTGIAVDVAVVQGHNVAKAIAQAVTDLGADAIAMATHGRGGLSRLVHGRVAGKVLDSVLMPVLFVRPRSR